MRQNQGLESFFTFDDPLGPVKAVKAVTARDESAFLAYFDKSNKIYKNIRHNKTMIVGRRGAGKTDALVSHIFIDSKSKFERYIIYFDDVESATLFGNILFIINNKIRYDEPRPMVETISSLWDHIFLILVVHKIFSNRKIISDLDIDFTSIMNFYGLSEAEQNPFLNSVTILESLIFAYDNSPSHRKLGFFSYCASMKVGIYSIRSIYNHVTDYLEKVSSKALILFDSFERLDVTQAHDRLALSGLLMSLGRMSGERGAFDGKCCIPAEMFHRLTDVSSNVIKDFERQILLHWSNIEILRLCAKRFQTFIRIHYRARKLALCLSNNLSSRDDVISFWNEFFFETIPNGINGNMELTVPYLLRHTQLLPRHMILLMNRIFSTHLANKDNLNKKVPADLIREVVREAEVSVTDEIIAAYQYIWPNARTQIVEILKNLGSNIISVGELRRSYNRANIKNYGNIHHFDDLMRMITEIGVVGRLINETEQYAVAAFEYSEPYRLIFNDSDMLCIHPCFTMSFRVLTTAEKPRRYVPIYPLGSRFEDVARRSFE